MDFLTEGEIAPCDQEAADGSTKKRQAAGFE